MQETNKTEHPEPSRAGGSGSCAVLVAVAATSGGTPACTLDCKGEPIISRLAAQLRRHGVDRIHVLTREAWRDRISAAVDGVTVTATDGLSDMLARIAELAGSARGDMLLGHADLVVHEGVVEGLLADPRVRTGILSATRAPMGSQCPRVRLARGRVVASESAYHQVARPTHVFLGMCRVSPGDRDSLIAAAHELSEMTRDGLPPEWEPELARKVRDWGLLFYRRGAAFGQFADHLERLDRAEPWLPDHKELREDMEQRFDTLVLRPAEALREDPVSLLVTGMVRRDVTVRSSYLRDLYWARPLSPAAAAEAAQALDQVDEDRVLLDSAVKASDGFFTTFFVSPYSKYIARWCARRGLTPNQVTSFSMALGVLAALAFAAGSRPGMIAGALLLQLAFTFDCVDGQLARYTRQFSKLGAWLDSVFDRAKEYVVYAGLAWGFAASTDGDGRWIWLLAAAALAFQTTRHFIDFSFASDQHGQIDIARRVPLERPRDVPLRKGAGASAAVSEESRDDPHLPQTEVPTQDTIQALRSSLGTVGVRLSARFEQRAAMRWAKRIIVLPIGERFALISLTAALFDARVTFLALLAWGAVAASYTVSGRTLRSLLK